MEPRGRWRTQTSGCLFWFVDQFTMQPQTAGSWEWEQWMQWRQKWFAWSLELS